MNRRKSTSAGRIDTALDDESKSGMTTAAESFKISEWPSNDDLFKELNQSTPCSSQCCFPKQSKMSILKGKTRSDRPNTSIIDYFVTQIESTDGKIVASNPALITTAKTFTYQEIHEVSDQIAMILKSKLSCKPTSNVDGDFAIGMAFPDRYRRVITQLAILKTGCCYLPIDYVNFPPKRILTMTNLIKPILIISTDEVETAQKFQMLKTKGICDIITIEDIWTEIESQKEPYEKIVDRQSLLLCQDFVQMRPLAIYYSAGPTDPQAIRIGNKALWNRIMWEWETFPYEKHETLVLQNHVFNIQCLAELFTPLLAGKPILITERLHAGSLLEQLRKHKVTRLAVFPSLLSCLITTMQLCKRTCSDASACPTFLADTKLWFCYRASLRVETARQFFAKVAPGTKLIQVHGAVETLEVSSYKVFESSKSFKDLRIYEVLPAGTPISNLIIYITDDQNNIVGQGQTGEISISGMQLPIGITGSSEELIPNPFFKHGCDESHKFLLKSGDFGKVVPGSCLTAPTLIFAGRAQSQSVMNNQRISIKEILVHLKAIKGIKGCHAMAYRPTTADQTVLAFAVPNRRNPISVSDIVEKLREEIPDYMIPVVVLVEGIPVGKNFEVLQTALIEAYFKEYENRMQFDDWNKLNLDSPCKLRAAKVLFEVMFTVTRISKRSIAENMNKSLFKLRTRFTNLPSILLSLQRNGYTIDFDEFMEIKDVSELIVKMAASREEIGDDGRLSFIQAYDIERINSKIRNEVLVSLSDIASNMRGTGSLFYFAEIEKKQLNLFLNPFWEFLMAHPLSVFARRKRDNKLAAAFLNVSCEDRKNFKGWTATYPMNYILEYIGHFDIKLLDRGLKHDNQLQTVFIVADSASFENYDEAVSILDQLFRQTIQLAKENGFESYSVISFDYVISSTAMDMFGFELVSSTQINGFEAPDKRKPFKLAPDRNSGSLLVKTLEN